VANTDAPFLAFNFRSTGADVFSSLEYNYGHPSQLLVTTAVTEPTSIALLVVGLLALGGIGRGGAWWSRGLSGLLRLSGAASDGSNL